MKRTIKVTADGVTITAVIDSAGHQLTRDEVEMVRDQLATRLQDAAADLRFMGTPRCNVKVI